MSDFHRSLDRALEHEPHWAIEHTTAFDDFDPRPLPDSWQDLGYVDETGIESLVAIQEKINRDVVRLAQMAVAPALFVEQPEVIIEWGNPARRTLLSREESAELLATNSVTIQRHWLSRWICGFDPRPTLAEQEIPAEGTE